MPFLVFMFVSYAFFAYFCIKKPKQNEIMGLGTYWARKDDQTGELKTVKPWEEVISNGDKYFPDPNGMKEEDCPESEAKP